MKTVLSKSHPVNPRHDLPLLFVLLACLGSPAFSQTKEALSAQRFRVDPLPKQLEVALALSAAPAHLREGVAVYILNPATGYILERNGTNGFTCYVQRTETPDAIHHNASSHLRSPGFAMIGIRSHAFHIIRRLMAKKK